MDAKEIERRTRDLGKAIAANEPSSSILTILSDLSKNVTATEEILRSTKVGKAVNRLKTHKNPEVARASADLVSKWKKDMKSETGAGKKTGDATPTATQETKENGAEEGRAEEHKEGAKEVKGRKGSVSLDQRSSKTDDVNTNVTGNSTRDNCVMLMYDGLANMSEEATALILNVATAIEQAAYTHLPPETSAAYKSKIRSLFQNLKSKSNPTLRVRVLGGDISPDRFVRMSLEELKSPERREEDKQMAKENMDKAMVAQVEKSISSALTCGKCRQKKVSYSQAQTRSADEPMTTFCECTVCGNRWKFS